MEEPKILTIIIATLILLAVITCNLEPDFQIVKNINRSASGFLEQKVYSRATLADNFRGDRVVVVLTREASRNFREYTVEDFLGIENLVRVIDATRNTMEIVRKQRMGDKEGLKKHIENGMLMSNTDNFRRIFDLVLSVDSKEQVLNIIQILQNRDDILYVGPDYLITTSSSMANQPIY